MQFIMLKCNYCSSSCNEHFGIFMVTPLLSRWFCLSKHLKMLNSHGSYLLGLQYCMMYTHDMYLYFKVNSNWFSTMRHGWRFKRLEDALPKIAVRDCMPDAGRRRKTVQPRVGNNMKVQLRLCDSSVKQKYKRSVSILLLNQILNFSSNWLVNHDLTSCANDEQPKSLYGEL